MNDGFDLDGAAPMQQGMMMQQQADPPTPEDFSGRDGRRHNYTTAEKRAFIEDLNTRVPQEHAVALGSSPTHNQLNTIYSELYGEWRLVGQPQQPQQQQQWFVQAPQAQQQPSQQQQQQWFMPPPPE